MPIRNAHWYSLNEGISYPVDEVATCVDDAGRRLPSNIIVDMNLRWPDTQGRYAFVSSISVTANIVSLTIQAATDLDDASSFVPLAVVAVPQPVAKNRQIALLPQLTGVGGWVVFGTGVDEEFRGRFSSPRQSVLTGRAVRAYRKLPVTGLRALDANTALTGIVTLKAQEPLSIAAEDREINGVVRSCIVVRLTEGTAPDDYPVPDAATKLVGFKESNIFQQYSGPCAGRPESRTCGDPQPIEFINAVGPDCDGKLTIEFQGCAKVAQVQDLCGIVIDCGLGLVDACVPPQIPDSEGYLPSERDPVNIPSPEEPTPEVPGQGESESVVVIGGLPYCDYFPNGETLYFNVISGLWTTVADGSDLWLPCGDSASTSTSDTGYTAYATATTATRNISLWEGFDESTLGRKFVTHFRMMPAPVGGKHNAAVVINYREREVGSGQYVYYLAEMHYDTQELRITRFNGTSFQVAVAYNVYGVQLNKWYEMEVATALPSGPLSNNVAITVRLRSLEDESIDVTIGPLVVSNFLPSNGYFGLHTYRALTRFSCIQLLENV